MKHKIITIIATMLFVLVVFPSLSSAQQMGEEIVVPTTPPTITITPTPDYIMPYPGILPDNPLYGLKTLRDKVISTMIGDSLKKAEFNLLQADKRIGAALLLMQTGNADKQEVALSTISKGQNYYEEAIAKTTEAKKQGSNTAEISIRMHRAGEQHIYQMKKAKKTLPKVLQETLDQLIARSVKLQSQVKLPK